MYQQFQQTVLPILPELVVIVVALSVLVLDFFVEKERKAILGWYSLGGIIIAAYASTKLMNLNGVFFNGTFLLDPFSTYFKFVFYSACGLGILVSINYLKIEDIHRGEYYALMLFATSGMMMMASAGDLITLYLGLELMALSVYILAGFIRRDNRSNEAAIKYLVLGAFSSGIMLYGM
jgi:NADH-quinone oxidoreductase subunit N